MQKLTQYSAVALLASGLIAGSTAVSADSYQLKEENATVSKQEQATRYWNEFKQDAEQTWDSSSEAFRDGWIEGKLETAIMANDSLSIFDIGVEVDDNTALLSGTVLTPVEKELAGNIAIGVDGISDVNNQIKVDESYSANEGKTNKRTFSTYLSDVSTTAAIKTKFISSDNLDGFNISVDTYKSTVTLKGEVESAAQKDLAEQIVENRKDVTSVNNLLDVRS